MDKMIKDLRTLQLSRRRERRTMVLENLIQVQVGNTIYPASEYSFVFQPPDAAPFQNVDIKPNIGIRTEGYKLLFKNTGDQTITVLQLLGYTDDNLVSLNLTVKTTVPELCNNEVVETPRQLFEEKKIKFFFPENFRGEVGILRDSWTQQLSLRTSVIVSSEDESDFKTPSSSPGLSGS